PSATPFQVSVSGTFPPPRLWFLNQDGSRVVQIQQDRVVVNWRKINPSDRYPRYQNLRQAMTGALDHLNDFLRAGEGSTLVVDQVELTYVNQLSAGQLGKPRTPLSHFLKSWHEPTSSVFQNTAEETSVRAQYTIKEDPPARLFVEVNSTYRTIDSAP